MIWVVLTLGGTHRDMKYHVSSPLSDEDEIMVHKDHSQKDALKGDKRGDPRSGVIEFSLSYPELGQPAQDEGQ